MQHIKPSILWLTLVVAFQTGCYYGQYVEMRDKYEATTEKLDSTQQELVNERDAIVSIYKAD